MTNWREIILPIVTLILGAALTMASQAVQDRRVAARQKRAQRQGFMAANFEVHRSAILEMQEVARDYHEAFLAEKARREHGGFYQYFDERRPSSIAAGILSGRAHIERINEAIQAISSGGVRQKELERIIKQEAKGGVSSFNKVTEDFIEMRTVMEGIYPFWDQSVPFMQTLRLCEFRSGSNS